MPRRLAASSTFSRSALSNRIITGVRFETAASVSVFTAALAAPEMKASAAFSSLGSSLAI